MRHKRAFMKENVEQSNASMKGESLKKRMDKAKLEFTSVWMHRYGV